MKNQLAYIMHIRDAILLIEEYTSAGEVSFYRDRKTQDAVVRNLEIIGEATKNLSMEFRAAHPEIPWKDMAGTRDKVIHEYFGVNLELVWDVVSNRLPILKTQIQALIR